MQILTDVYLNYSYAEHENASFTIFATVLKLALIYIRNLN